MMKIEDWIGKKREAHELVTERLFREFKGTFGDILQEDNLLPGLHWCLLPEIYPPADLGRDGHPKTGLFLPDLGLPRRMWAGGNIRFHNTFSIGEVITRTSNISDIKFKEGRSGKLGFVTLEHEYNCEGELRVSEVQNIVYREDHSKNSPTKSVEQAEPWDVMHQFEAQPSSTLLFRYSAMTFNGHRIHYDKQYAIETEGYDGLVVHGPIQATWMQLLATQTLKRLPKNFTYRGLAPLVCDRPAVVEVTPDKDGLKLRVRDLEANVVTMSAVAN